MLVQSVVRVAQLFVVVVSVSMLLFLCSSWFVMFIRGVCANTLSTFMKAAFI